MPEGVPPRFWNVPNTLTLSRLVLAIVVFACISSGHYLPALVVFAIAALTDALDGYFARLLDQGTAIGRQLDPLIDKVIVAGAYIYLLNVPGTGVMPWMVTTIVIRELLIQGLRSHLEGQGQPFGARASGKLKTVFQCASIIAILVCISYSLGPAWIKVRDGLTWGAVGLTIYSGLAYVTRAIPGLR